ncbi:MAG: HAD family phosphatase [Chloroflexi bacterium]|nr:HAD family phosphatase [Chloroflexota bacterium]
MIRLVALDLDGTLLGADFRVADADSEAVRAALERGVHVVINTSRWYGLANRTARRLELRAPMVCHNGAHIREPLEGEELLHLRIPQAIAREIAACCDEGGWETYTSVDGITYMRSRWDAQIDPARLPPDMRPAKNHAEHVTADATGFVVFGEDAVAALIERFAGRYADVLAFPVGVGESRPYVTITAGGVDKGTGLLLVCERLGVAPEEAMAVGDAVPDVAMFEVAGTGVAMGNAPDEVKALATATAPANTEGGVAWAIRRFVFER